MQRRLLPMAATLGALAFLVLTSSDVATLLAVVVHLAPNWALTALFILGTFLSVRWLLRRLLGSRLAPVIRAADRTIRRRFVWTLLPAAASILLILVPLLGLQRDNLLVLLVTVLWSLPWIDGRLGPVGRAYLARLRPSTLARP